VLGPLLAIVFALFALVILSTPAAAHPASPAAPTHAYPVREDPPDKALLQAPPSGVTITFSENVNPATSRIIVVDPTNRELDNRDSQVSSADGHVLSVTLPLLPAGTYVVVWKAQSADDGHVTGGSYYFQIARPDGTAPPLPKTLPNVNGLGNGGTGAESVILDGPTLLQAIATWLALLFMTLWVGGVFWETWILPPDRADLDPDLAAAANLAAERFRRLAAPALALLLLSNVLVVLAQSAALAGDWSGLFAPQLLRAILFGNRYGLFWWGRELTALASLILLVVASQYGWRWTRGAVAPDAGQQAEGVTSPAAAAIPDWRRELIGTLRGIRALPRQMAQGWRHRSWIGRIELMLAVLLLLAFALSGHAAAVPSTIFLPAITVDLLHLAGDAAWLGGLFYIGVVLVPALASLPLRRRARFLALGLPRFGALAILSAAVLAATGSLNATIRMSSFAQLFTTAYGRTLAIKIELFLVMAAISAYHAFWLRPRLARALAATAATEVAPTMAARSALVVAGQAHPAGAPVPVAGERDDNDRSGRARAGSAENGKDQPEVRSLAERLEAWLRREALIGVAVLICVALLGAYAGTLATAPAGPPTTTGSGPYISQTQQAGAYHVVLKVTPDTFGTNTFVVTLTDANGNAVNNASVLVQTTDLDMDMGTQSIDLKPMPGVLGSYSGQGDLTMAGNWGVLVKVLAPGASDYVSTSFKFVASYGS
jgi:putative copper export protein/methionine-rich copper-binding protein CopC